jgi:hypothetical protein
MFCSTVGHARRQTAGAIGPSTIDRSNFARGGVACAGGAASAATSVEAVAFVEAAAVGWMQDCSAN